MTFGKVILVVALLFMSEQTRNVQEDEIKRAVEQFLASKLDSTKEKFSIEYRSLPAKVLNIPKEATLRIVANSRIELRNNITLPVEVFADDHVAHTFLVSVRIRRYGQVLIATDMLEKNEPGEAVAATEEVIETTLLPSDLVTSQDQLKGKRAKRIIKRGAVLTESMFERLPMVTQGSVVTLLVRSNNVVIKTKATVLRDGVPGDTILVQRGGTSEKLKARVVNEYTVEMVPHK